MYRVIVYLRSNDKAVLAKEDAIGADSDYAFTWAKRLHTDMPGRYRIVQFYGSDILQDETHGRGVHD
jgi:hypothetical protein